MEITLLYYTPAYHKLVEYAARRCYDSFDKCGLDSHKLVRGIMAKGHLSVSGHGNIVFGVTFDKPDHATWKEQGDTLKRFLIYAKEVNNFIRWTSEPEGSKFDVVFSMNILTFMQTVNPTITRDTGNTIRAMLTAIVDHQQPLRWFYDKEVTLPSEENPYLGADPKLLKPHVLVSDYQALKEQGLTDYELDVHSTVTVEIVSDRAMSLQDARHKDMMARSEISQRYVDFNNFEYRLPNGIDPMEEFFVPELEGDVTYPEMMEIIKGFYRSIQTAKEERGASKLRAKEFARSILPNATLTHYIDTRPLKQWKHFIHLRDDIHAQSEKQDDAKALIAAFREVGIPL